MDASLQELEALKQEIKEAEHENRTCQAELDRLTSETQYMVNQVRETQKQYEELLKIRDQLDRDRQTAQIKVDALGQQKADIHQQIQHLCADNDKLERRLRELQ